jgi:hypothetical protein
MGTESRVFTTTEQHACEFLTIPRLDAVIKVGWVEAVWQQHYIELPAACELGMRALEIPPQRDTTKFPRSDRN